MHTCSASDNVKGGMIMDKLLARSVFDTLEEAYVSPYLMTTQIYPLGRETIFYTCNIVNIDYIIIRFLGVKLIYSRGRYDAYATGIDLGKSFSEIQKGFEIDIDSEVKEAIDEGVKRFFDKHAWDSKDKKK